MHYKGYKIRIYPTKEQEHLIWQHIGARRFVWNYMLELQEQRHKNGETHLSAFGMNYLIKELRQEHDWLCDIAAHTLYGVCADLANAYKRFFNEGLGHPKFKSRKNSKPTYPIRSDTMHFKGKVVVLEKLGKVKYKSDFQFPQGRGHKFTNVRLTYINEKYILSFDMECESQAPIELTDKPMGIDLGIKELAVVSYGGEQIVFHNINKSKRIRTLNKRLVYLHKSMARKYRASSKRNNGKYIKTNNIKREELKIKKLYGRIANIRNNYLHQTTHKLVLMSPNKVVMEHLDVKNMMKNRHLSKAVGEQGFGEFARQMRYKCEWNGIPFIRADRFYPSSKKCSNCGEIKKDLKLKDRTYICPHCGFRIDRDYNAAINLMRYEA